MPTRAQLDLFAARFEHFASWPVTKQTDYLVYYLLSMPGIDSVTAGDIDAVFAMLDLRVSSRTSVYLSEAVKSGYYIKHPKGYRLERSMVEKIRSAVDLEPKRVEVSAQLAALVSKVKDTQERSFLEESIRSFRVEANRAAIVMAWTLAMDHMQKYTFGTKLSEFNAAVSAHSDKRMQQIINYDDFSELKETRIIELMRSAGVITNDVRKILDEKLGIRNSAGHPSGITISSHKATEFILDLVENILLKY